MPCPNADPQARQPSATRIPTKAFRRVDLDINLALLDRNHVRVAQIVPPLAVLFTEDVCEAAMNTLARIRRTRPRHDDLLSHEHDEIRPMGSRVLQALLD